MLIVDIVIIPKEVLLWKPYGGCWWRRAESARLFTLVPSPTSGPLNGPTMPLPEEEKIMRRYCTISGWQVCDTNQIDFSSDASFYENSGGVLPKIIGWSRGLRPAPRTRRGRPASAGADADDRWSRLSGSLLTAAGSADSRRPQKTQTCVSYARERCSPATAMSGSYPAHEGLQVAHDDAPEVYRDAPFVETAPEVVPGTHAPVAGPRLRASHFG